MDLRFSQIKREEIGVKFGCFKFDKSSGRYSVTKPMRFQQGWTQRDLIGGGGGGGGGVGGGGGGGGGGTGLKIFQSSARSNLLHENFHGQALLVLKLHLCDNNNITVFVVKLHLSSCLSNITKITVYYLSFFLLYPEKLHPPPP